VDRLGHMFYRAAHVAVFLFDVTDILSFIFVKKLIGAPYALSFDLQALT